MTNAPQAPQGQKDQSSNQNTGNQNTGSQSNQGNVADKNQAPKVGTNVQKDEPTAGTRDSSAKNEGANAPAASDKKSA